MHTAEAVGRELNRAVANRLAANEAETGAEASASVAAETASPTDAVEQENGAADRAKTNGENASSD